jgi:rhodanese-related sulfurtransferase
MSIDPNLPFIEPQVLSEAITEHPDSKSRDFVIVDVRGNDFAETGHIPGCVNVPSDTFTDPEVLKTLYEENRDKSTFIFHCGQSKIRGPTSATAFSEYVAKAIPEGERPVV